MSRKRIKKPKEFKTRLEARIAAYIAEHLASPSGDFRDYKYHKPGSQNRKK